MNRADAASRRVVAGIAAMGGLAAFLALHLLFRLTWDGLFSTQPWPGYEESARRGLLEPWFVHSPRSLWLTRATFFALALACAYARPTHAWLLAAALWLGAALGVVLTWATTSARLLDWGWLGFLLYPLRVLLPILLGTAAGLVIRRVVPAQRRA